MRISELLLVRIVILYTSAICSTNRQVLSCFLIALLLILNQIVFISISWIDSFINVPSNVIWAYCMNGT